LGSTCNLPPKRICIGGKIKGLSEFPIERESQNLLEGHGGSHSMVIFWNNVVIVGDLTGFSFENVLNYFFKAVNKNSDNF